MIVHERERERERETETETERERDRERQRKRERKNIPKMWVGEAFSQFPGSTLILRQLHRLPAKSLFSS